MAFINGSFTFAMWAITARLQFTDLTANSRGNCTASR